MNRLQKQREQDWMTSQQAEMSIQQAEMTSLAAGMTSQQAVLSNQQVEMTSQQAEEKTSPFHKRGSLKHVSTKKEEMINTINMKRGNLKQATKLEKTFSTAPGKK